MAGLFGSSARLRQKSLAAPQPYVPALMPEPSLTTGGYPPPPLGSSQSAAQPANGSPFANAPELMQPRTLSAAPVATGPALDIPSSMYAAKIKPHFFDQTGTGTKLIQLLGDLSTQWGAAQGQPWAMHELQMREQQANAEREDVIWSRRHDLQRKEALEDAERARNAPRYFSGKEDQLSYDPASGRVSTIYDAPEEYQTYAAALGYEPGSPEYRGALTDYVLRGYGPTAAGVRTDLQSQRLEGQASMEALRQHNRLALKQTPGAARPRGNGYGHGGGAVGVPRTTGNVYAPILAKVARGEALSPGEQRVLDMRGGHRGGAGGSAGGQTATDPKTGRKVMWNGSAWVPAN